MKPGSFGVCALCSSRKGKAAMVAHLKRCLSTSSGASDRPLSPVMLLRVQAGGAPMFWLDLVVTPEARLKEADGLLRRVWLECCGHLSEFYTSGHRQVSMNRRIGEALGAIGSRLGYVYDFGSSTELVVTLSGFAEAGSGNPVRVAARNEPPTFPCEVCGQPATAVCGQCAYEGSGFCCTEHESSHDCGAEMLLPVVNSPRMGVCGYTGEA